MDTLTFTLGVILIAFIYWFAVQYFRLNKKEIVTKLEEVKKNAEEKKASFSIPNPNDILP